MEPVFVQLDLKLVEIRNKKFKTVPVGQFGFLFNGYNNLKKKKVNCLLQN